MKKYAVAAAIIFIGLLATPCSAAETASAAEPASEAGPVRSGLAVIDWIIIAVYGCGTIGLGWFYSRKQQSTQEYFVGSGNMNPILVGVSLFATLLSTISYLSMPGEALGKGPVFMMSLLMLPVVFAIVGFYILPLYMKQKVTSAYELLEEKLGLSIRMLGAGMFIVLRLVWMALLIYLTAKALTIMLGVGEEKIPLIAMVTGFVAVIYTSLGGIKAVIITDFIQTVLLFGGAVLVVGVISWDLGGFGWFPTEWNPTWDTQPFFSTDPSTRVTVVGTLVSVLIWYVCTSAGDQTSVQRFMATKDANAARLALGTQLCVSVVVSITLGCVGFALLGYFSAHPDQLPASIHLKDNADKVFPHFIAFHLPPGVSGLVVAAMFAAAMSSIDSGVNSITAVVMSDVLDRHGHAPKSEADHIRLARWLAFGIGAFVVATSSFMGLVPGNITEVTGKTSNLLTTPIFCLFFFALFVPFASPRGVWVGAFFGTLTAAIVAFGGPIVLGLHLAFEVQPETFGTVLETTLKETTGNTTLSCPDPISFQWIAPLAVLVNIAVGCVASKLMPRQQPS
ncbi:MAG: sodium:solute symporter family transporter [Planctomycetales bacterium]